MFFVFIGVYVRKMDQILADTANESARGGFALSERFHGSQDKPGAEHVDNVVAFSVLFFV